MLLELLRAWLRGSKTVPLPQAQPRFSFVICSVDEARFACVSANLHQRMPGREGHDWELIRIPDARSLAEGYNRGLARSRGEFIVFCHDDIELLQGDVAARLLAHLATHDVLGVAGTTCLKDSHWISAGSPAIHGQVLQPIGRDGDGGGYVLNVFCQHARAAAKVVAPVQAVDGLFMAARRSVAEALRFDEVTFDGFHLYDLDFSYRAFLQGYRVGICHDVLIYHQSSGNKDERWRRQAVRFEDKFAVQLSRHGREPAGPPLVYQLAVTDRAQGLAAFEGVLRGEVTFEVTFGQGNTEPAPD